MQTKSLRNVHPPLVVVLIAAIVIGACRSSTPPVTPLPSNPTPPVSISDTNPAPTEAVAAGVTAWGQVESQIQPDGTVTANTALQAFALAVAPLPGITPPAGEPGQLDANLALAWVKQVWAQLSPEQQGAIEAALAPLSDPYAESEAAPAANASYTLAAWRPLDSAAPAADPNCGEFLADPAAIPSDIPPAVQPAVDIVKQAYDAFASHLGRQSVPKLAVCLVPGVTLAAPLAVRPFDAQHMQVGLPASCTIFLNSDWVGAVTDARQLSLELAVSTFLCFQVTANPAETLDAFYARAIAWVFNGTATWAGATVVDNELGGLGSGALSEPWSGYLTEPDRGLFVRGASAIGFFAQVDQDPALTSAWDVLDATVTAADNQAAFEAATGLRQSFIDRWAAGYFRDGTLGADWDIVGPAITADKPEDAEMEIANGQVDYLPAAPLAVAIVDLSTSADVTLFAGDHLRIHDGVQDLKEIGSQTYCTKPGGANACICPKDTPGAKLPPLQSLNREVKLALTGMESGGVATIRGLSLEEYCGKPPTAQPASGVWSLVFWSPDEGDTAPPLMVAYTCEGLVSTWQAIYLPSIDDLTRTFELPFADNRIVHHDFHRDIPTDNLGAPLGLTLDYSLDFKLNAEVDPPVIIVTGTKTETKDGQTWVFPPREFGSDAPLEVKNVSLETQLTPYPDYQHPFRAQALAECGG